MSEAHPVSSQSNSGAVCSVKSASSGLKVRAVGRLTGAAVETWAGQRHVAEGGAEGHGIAPLAPQGTATGGAAPVPGDMGGGLGLDDASLQAAEQGLALGERQADRLDSLLPLLKNEDLLVADRLALVGDDPQPDLEAHGACPKLDFPQCLERKTRSRGEPP